MCNRNVQFGAIQHANIARHAGSSRPEPSKEEAKRLQALYAQECADGVEVKQPAQYSLPHCPWHAHVREWRAHIARASRAQRKSNVDYAFCAHLSRHFVHWSCQLLAQCFLLPCRPVDPG